MYSILYVSESKRQAETISYFGDFRDVLASGETITSQVVTVTIITGTDPDPSSMLYGGIEVHNNATVIEQRIKQGVVGAIYDILFTVGTSLGNTFEKLTRLAILPTNLPATALHSTWYRTSDLYPYNAPNESITGQFYPAGIQQMWLQPSFKDGMQGQINMLSGSLFVGATFYTALPESIQGTIAMQNGTLVLAAITYNSLPEAIKGNAALINGTLQTGQVSYVILNESIQGTISMQHGTLL